MVVIKNLRAAFFLTFFKLKYRFVFAVYLLLFTFLYIYIPIFTTPSHSFSFFLEITSFWRWFLSLSFSFLISLLLSMQTYLWFEVKVFEDRKSASLLSATGAFASSLFSCIACSATLFTVFLPASMSYFLSSHVNYILAIGAIMAVYGIGPSAKAIAGNCDSCRV